MAVYVVAPKGPPTPGSIENLVGGKQAKASPLASVMLQQDRVWSQGARVVAHVGIYGAGEWQVPSTNPTNPTQTYPLASDERIAGQWKVYITPGYQLMAAVTAQPSGAQQKNAGGGAGYILSEEGAGGHVKIVVDYTEPSVVVTQTVFPPVSKETYYGETTDDAWATITGPVMVDLRYAAAMTIATEAEKNSRTVHAADITVYYIGGVRIQEVVIWEVPTGYAHSTSSEDYISAHMYADGHGAALKSYPSQYPIDEKDVDYRFGALHALRVAVYAQQQFGPSLVSACAWDEVDVAVTDTAPHITISSTSWTDVFRPSISSYAESNPGWSVSAGSNARLHDLSGDLHELRDVDGVVPVQVYVVAACNGGLSFPGTVRVQTSKSSYVDVTVTSTTIQAYEMFGELRCGIGAEDFSSLQVLGMVATFGVELDIYGIWIGYDQARYKRIA